jgi:nucleotide-binding universal stress UspA family protein
VALVVVGVDGSEESKEALRWALEEARLRGASLRAVLAWLEPAVYVHGYAAADFVDPALATERAKELLEATLAEVAGDAPTVLVERVVAEGGAAEILVESSREADLLVVGSRGRGGFAGLLVGSVSRHCVEHASCPVAVVRPRPRAPA